MADRFVGQVLRGFANIFRTPGDLAAPSRIDLDSPIQTVADTSRIAAYGKALGLQEGWFEFTVDVQSTGIGFDTVATLWNGLPSTPDFAEDGYTAWIYQASMDIVASVDLADFESVNARISTGEAIGPGTAGAHTVFLGDDELEFRTSAVGSSLGNQGKPNFPMPWHANTELLNTLETDAAAGTIDARLRLLMRFEAKGNPPAGWS